MNQILSCTITTNCKAPVIELKVVSTCDTLQIHVYLVRKIQSMELRSIWRGVSEFDRIIQERIYSDKMGITKRI